MAKKSTKSTPNGHSDTNGGDYYPMGKCPFPIFETHPTFPPLSDSVNVVYNEAQGRHVVARRSIAAGEAVSIEDPIAWHLSPYKTKANCCHCLR